MIDGINLTDVSGWTVAAGSWLFVVVALIKGWIVPGNLARMWFEAWQTDRHTVDRLAEDVGKLTKSQEAATAFIASIQAVGERMKEDQSP